MLATATEVTTMKKEFLRLTKTVIEENIIG
jgi:hypothetical protein